MKDSFKFGTKLLCVDRDMPHVSTESVSQSYLGWN